MRKPALDWKRKPVPDRERRKVRGVRFSDEEWALVKKDAAEAGETVAQWVRYCCGV